MYYIIEKFLKKIYKYRKKINIYWLIGYLDVLINKYKVSRELKLLSKFHSDNVKIDFLFYRNKKLSKILNYAQTNCSYYSNLFKEFGINADNLKNFENLPLLDKIIIKNNKNKLISSKINQLPHYIMNTGGSTGEPLEFPATLHTATQHQAFLYKIIGYKKGDIIAAFDGTSIPENLRAKNIFWSKKNYRDIPYGRISYSSLYLTKETIYHYVNNIISLKPSFLRGYPSFISQLASFIIENDIKIQFKIKGVELTAEIATDEQVNLIKNAFNTKVFFQYGHSEVSVFGYTLDNSYEYFCSPFYGFTEVLNSEGKHVKIGEEGEIVVTGFNNIALPFIRYKTGDIAIFNGDINGIVRLKKILGRTQDYIYSKNNDRVSLTALVFGCHYHAFANIIKWQIVQNMPGHIDIHIIKGNDFRDKDEKEIRDNFLNTCGIETNFIYVDSIQLTGRGKSKFLIQNIKQI